MRGSRFLAAGLFVVTLTLILEAQQPRSGGGGQLNTTNLVLTNKALQEELQITDAQREKFKDVAEKLAELNKKRQAAIKDAAGDKDKLKEANAAIQKESMALNAEIRRVVNEALTLDQRKRLRQVDLQVRGVRAFADKGVAKKLDFTDAQKEKIASVLDTFTKDTKGLAGPFGKNADKDKVAENRKKREELTKAATAEINGTLTAEQKDKWKEMTGEVFDLAKLRQGGRKKK